MSKIDTELNKNKQKFYLLELIRINVWKRFIRENQ